MELVAAGQRQLHLHPGAGEVQRERDQGIAVLLHPGLELADLPAVEQQPSGAPGVLVEDIALLIGGYVHPVQEHLPVLHRAEGVPQVHRPQPDGLDLRAGQLDARLVLVLDEIVVERLPVGGDLLARLLGHGASLLSPTVV